MLFYHVSQTRIPVGSTLLRRMERKGRDPMLAHPKQPAGTGIHACYMAPTIEDATAWVHMTDKPGRWYLHTIYVPDETWVQVHTDGFWTCDGPGVTQCHWFWMKTKDVPTFIQSHNVKGMDGEILCHSRVRVVQSQEVTPYPP